jgi:hypothetical protein
MVNHVAYSFEVFNPLLVLQEYFAEERRELILCQMAHMMLAYRLYRFKSELKRVPLEVDVVVLYLELGAFTVVVVKFYHPLSHEIYW